MRSVRALPFLIFGLAGSSSAQDCSIPFLVPMFDVHAELGIPYGTVTRFNGTTIELAMDLYKPIGDDQTERPLVVAIHGGGFTSGSRADLQDLCQGLASMGWAAATISYRLGFYGNGILEPPYAYDPAEIHRAAYRAAQDAKAAIRFLKGRHALDSTSTNSVFLIGFSAGAITSLHAAYMDEADEKPSSCGAIGDVQHFFNFYPRPDLGPVEGELNQNGQDASVMGVVSIFGAIADTAWMAGEVDPALYTYHQSGDPIVGCGHAQPYWGVGLGVPDQYPYMHGSCSIDGYVQQIESEPGHYMHHLHNGNAHDVHDVPAVLLEASIWMRELFCAAATHVDGPTAHEDLQVHPNPANGLLHVSGPGVDRSPYRVTDALGRTIRTGTMEQGTLAIDLLAPGMYHLHLDEPGRKRLAAFVVAR